MLLLAVSFEALQDPSSYVDMPVHMLGTGEHYALEVAGDSMVEYAKWIVSGEPGEPGKSPILTAIRNYNEDDCRSTAELVLWLRGLQRQNGTVPAVTGMGLSDALYVMGNAGYKVTVRGSGVVANQSVTGGSVIPKGSRILLELQ